ncbi:ubiquitin-conjugating enzyme E2 [Skeletonema marinoi]|uniref:Ubiquitin-conjugating enzyme E2 n=1 Tax=Skeletonema marinoi TaxID=267567 RepID=A0AAD8YB44_9STRA|nr:ubiquitin-conjugating enzyme E2 [Skeletonema marinoi]
MQPSVIVEKACNRTKQESASASSSPTLTQLPSQEKIEHKRKRKSRRRRKENDNNLAKDDVSLSSLPSNRTKSTSHSTTTLESNHKLVQTTEEFENNLHISNDGNNNTSTAAIVTNETVVTYDDKDECEAVETDILLSQSQSNATNKVTVQESVSSVKATDRKLNAAKNKKKKATIKKANASKSTTTSSTGKEGECLRRIKHEWKNAVKSGIAYDWISMKSIRNTNTTSSAYVRIGPFGKNLLRWHFSVAGPSNSVYENGIYHGRVLLPKDYPASPPRVQMITPSGRFIPGHDICLSASSYHPETWTPRWTVLSLVDGLRLHMLTTANEIGGVLASDEKRRQYAIESRSWKYHGIANHERMVEDNIFALPSLSSGGDDGGNDCEKETNSDKSNIVNSAIASDELVTDEVTTGEDLKCEKNKDVTCNEDVVKDCPEHEKDDRTSVKRKKSKSKKNKTSEDLIGEEHSNVVTPAEDAITSIKASEKDASKPVSTNIKATKRKKKSRVTSAVETGENSTQQDIHAKNEAPKKKKKKKNRKKKSPVISAVHTVDDLTHGQSSNKSTSTKKKKKKKSRKKSTDVQVEAEEQSITTVLLKRLLVEMLKLPLRVLAILIRILDRLENYMRAILDGI